MTEPPFSPRTSEPRISAAFSQVDLEAGLADRAASRRRWDRKAMLLVLLLALLAIAPFAAWRLTPVRPLSLVIIDKTVPHDAYREHEALDWWLDHRRFVTPRGTRWSARRDYLGYDPVHRRGATIDSAAVAGASLIYIADAYGVYSGDYARTDTASAALEHSAMIYGGISAAEAQALADAQRGGAGVVAEFNTLESPTSGDRAAGDILAPVLGARYDGWLGRWYPDLASEEEIPRWMRERWARTRGSAWSFTGEGLVLFAEESERMAVVPRAQFSGDVPVTIEIDVPDDPLVRGARSGRPYWYWFAGVSPAPGARVLASFELHLTDEGKAALAAAGFPMRFPAIVRRGGAPLGAYLAGDFADVAGSPSRFRGTRGVDWLLRWSARGGARGRSEDVYWNVVTGVWEGMVGER